MNRRKVFTQNGDKIRGFNRYYIVYTVQYLWAFGDVMHIASRECYNPVFSAAA